MNLMRKSLSSFGAAAMLAFSVGAAAAPIPFTITAATFTHGAGYGIDNNENSGETLLDVRFSTAAFLAQNFALNAGDSHLFALGTINLNEPNSGGGITANETNLLGVTAELTFTAPTGVSQTITTTGVAVTGSVSDTHLDYSIDWAPVNVLFGDGGSFQISLADMFFNGAGTQTQWATISLTTAPNPGVPSNEIPANEIPEPTSIALFGAGIGLAALIRRRRTAAVA